MRSCRGSSGSGPGNAATRSPTSPTRRVPAGRPVWLDPSRGCRATPAACQRILRLGSMRSSLVIRRLLHPDRSGGRGPRAQQRPAGRARLARRRQKPVVLTLYGTEIWHYRKKRGPDLFTRAYHAASYVTFYSDRLLARAHELGLGRRKSAVVYPPVGASFVRHDEDEQAAARLALGISSRHLLVNVKRLHPLAGQRFLIEAMNEVIRDHPDTKLVICGTGPLADELKTATGAAGVQRHVHFAGLIDNARVARYCAASDLFVLPSILEALPTVAVEALACGTPVVSADNPGGRLELNELFGPDSLVPGSRSRSPTRSATSSGTRRTLADGRYADACSARPPSPGATGHLPS